ncbi:MAG: hypothetical protein CME64_08795 [Halobacteriovoraceae bacterium]|nr:hypothetical protein [Halobacteriovoraceae bacterium]|tara:strand:+ start:298169 stop:298402 length:234 start_codon:yes stop_codon:yes gene_type:complete
MDDLERRKHIKKQRRKYTKGRYAFLVVLLLMFIVFLPVWPYSANWGYYPSTGVGLMFLVFLMFLLGVFAITDDGSSA